MTSQSEEAVFHIVSVMLDGADFSRGRYAVEHSIFENAPHCGVWFEKPSWNLGLVIPWAEDKLVLHISFNGGNMRRSFWRECVFPRVEQYIGAIFVLNASSPDSFRETRYLLMEYQRQDIDSNLFSVPPVIALTGYDEPSAWDQADIALYLRDVLTDNLFLRVNPTDWNSVKEMLITSCAYFADFL